MALRRFSDGERYLIGNFEAVAVERHDFLRMVREHANSAQTEINQNLRADSAFTLQQALAIEVAVNFPALVDRDFRQRAFFGRRGVNSKAAAGVMQIDKNAAIGAGDCVERAVDELIAIARG